jgi:hypothetical protein
MYNFKQVSPTKEKIIEYSNFLSSIYLNTNKFSYEFLKWQYLDNPDGSVIGFDAYYNDVLAAHYVTIPVKCYVNGKLELGLLSLNTATHEEHRGKRLFTKLANLTYDYAKNNNFKFVCGVANSNSIHGFTKYLGFTSKPLMVKVGLGKVMYNSNKINYSFKREWTKKSLKWRLSNPFTEYRVSNREINYFPKFGLKAILGQFKSEFLIENKNRQYKFQLLKMYVGLDSSIDWSRSFYFKVPNRLKSSPLIFIYKSLESTNIDIDKVKFQIIDFDGY